ncbi:ESX-1 secretion-associated protein [Mycolicibacterium cyprinidarum]|uniref:ESX-1 secretion-associated protein n=1 Tax=Mycolicibacterium cyprinidarum TaxID=2860311 RepID=A0ABQ4VCF0_9MYCO|nr:ESX-1 secretion-associated protein [Mycolicibacterium sp. NGTWSNA01]GJF15653.1 ESX-1 secretion-associated protein [Mycolicibacterium sp. NGTWS0302]
MSHETLQVTTAHLRELAAKHGQAAAEITSATEAVSGLDSAIRTSHGVIAWSTAAAVEMIQQVRRDIGNSLAGESHVLGENLTTAAGRYEATDHASGAGLDRQIPANQTTPGPRFPR